MVKNKIKTYVLSVVVLAIWGVIGYQIYSALNPSEEEFSVPEVPVAFQNETNKIKDTFSIQNNYRDPFLGKLPEQKTQPVVQQVRRPVINDSVIFPTVEYQGMVQRAGGSETVFSVSVNGVASILSPGQSLQEVSLIKGNAQEITVIYKGKRKTIRK